MIGPSIKIKGEISGDEDLLIQGRVEGSINLQAHEVVVGESGQVSADITARTVKIDGRVNELSEIVKSRLPDAADEKMSKDLP